MKHRGIGARLSDLINEWKQGGYIRRQNEVANVMFPDQSPEKAHKSLSNRIHEPHPTAVETDELICLFWFAREIGDEAAEKVLQLTYGTSDIGILAAHTDEPNAIDGELIDEFADMATCVAAIEQTVVEVLADGVVDASENSDIHRLATDLKRVVSTIEAEMTAKEKEGTVDGC